MIAFRAPRAAALATALLAASLPAAAADRNKVFRYAFPIAETSFDPQKISDLYSNILNSAMFDAPLKYDYLARPLKLKPNTLAALPEISADGLTYTLRVKPGIFFADDPAFGGQKRELVAEDYAYSIKRHFDPRKRSPNLYQFEGQIVGMDEVLADARKNNRMDYERVAEGLRALDRYTFQIRLKQPNYNFLYYLAYCNLTCAVAREVVERYGDDIGSHPVGTGPFRLAFWKRSSKIVFEPNPNYREDLFDATPPADDAAGQFILSRLKGRRLPLVDKVEVYVIEEPQPRWLAFLNNELDFLERVPNEFANVATPNNELAPNLRKRGVRMERNIVGDHVARDPAEQRRTTDDDDGKAVHQLQDEAASPDDDRHAHDQAEHHQPDMVLGRGGDGDDVVEAHDRVGHHDRADRAEQVRARVDVVALALLLRQQQLDADPQQQEAAAELEEGNAQQLQREIDQHHAQRHRTEHTPEDRLLAPIMRKAARGERNDDRVVTAEQDVDEDDLADCDPELGRGEFHC